MKKHQEDTFQMQEEQEQVPESQIQEEQIQEEQTQEEPNAPDPQEPQAEAAPAVSQAPQAATPSPVPAPGGRSSKGHRFDQYEHWDERLFETAGLYRVVPDENGQPKIRFTGTEGASSEAPPAPNTGRFLDVPDEIDQNLRVLLEERIGLEQLLPADIFERKASDEPEEQYDTKQ